MNTSSSLKNAAAVLTLMAASSLAAAPRSWNAPHVVTAYCSGCHGVDGNTQLPYFPKLAGLDAAYAEKKMNAFKEPCSPPVDQLFVLTAKMFEARKDKSNLTLDERINMEGVAHASDLASVKEAVVWYAKQPASAGRPSNGLLAEKGKDIFLHGIPTQKILACATCHGADAQGQGTAPRLAGQNTKYMESQLTKFRKGDRKHAPEMTMVTKDLDEEQAREAVAYLHSR